MCRSAECWASLWCLLAATAALVAEQRGLAAAPWTVSEAAIVKTPPAPEIAVKAWRTFGTGRADATLQSINPPDGLAFTSDGLLLATDAMNHRVQIFDPKSGVRLGSFGSADVFPGEIVDVAAAMDGSVFVSDKSSNRIRAFTRAGRGNPLFGLARPPMQGGVEFKRPTGLACDSAGRLYAINTTAGEVHRFLPGLVLDPTWHFQPLRPDGGLMLNHADGIAIDEKNETLFASDEWEGMIRAYDAKTGRWLGKTIGRRCDPVSAQPIGQSVFSRSVEGLALLGDYLLAVDEGFSEANTDRPGRLLVFNLREPAVYESDAETCRARMAANKPAGLVGWLGNFWSPDGVAVFAGSPERPEPLVAVADQRHYRVVLYKAADLLRAIRSAAAKESP